MVLVEALAGGLFAVYLPFLLVFAIFYALLVKTKVFGSGGNANKINALVALIISLYVTVFSPFAPQISIFFATYFTGATIGIVVLMVFIMVVGLLLGPFVTTQEGWAQLGKKFIPLIVIIAFLFALGLFFGTEGVTQMFGDIFGTTGGIGGISGDDIALIVIIIVTIVVLYWLTSGEEGIKTVKLLGE